MLAYYVEWHLRRKWAPPLFDDEELEQAAALRRWPVAPAEPSASAQKKARTKRTRDGLPAQSFQGLLEELGTLRAYPKNPCVLGNSEARTIFRIGS